LLGNYNPRNKAINLKTDRIKYWLSKGAQASDSVHNLLVKAGVTEGAKKKAVFLTKKRKAKMDSEKAKAQPAEAPKEAVETPKTEEVKAE
jgi:small subunit ribosomal protein S16